MLDAIRSRPEIEELATNPVMLTALAALHWNRTRLPDQRTELYQSVLEWLAQAREENRKDLREEATVRMSAVECLAMMEHLAFTMHSDPRGRQTEITLNAAARALAPRFRGLPETNGFAAAEQFLQEEETDSGILIRRGNTLRFWHLTFQEYLAAKALAVARADRRAALHGANPVPRRMAAHRTVARRRTLPTGRGTRRSVLSRDPGRVWARTPTLAERARCVGLIGSALRDLKSWGYRLTDPRYAENLDRCLAVFDAREARQVDFATRLEAADAIGQAGDPRLDHNDPAYWVRVEGGPFWMGAQKSDPKGRNYDPEAYADEAPVHQEEVRPFAHGTLPGDGSQLSPVHGSRRLQPRKSSGRRAVMGSTRSRGAGSGSCVIRTVPWWK